MSYDARVVANYFLELADRDQIAITPLKLQKLLYIAHGWSLALRGQPLIEQNIKAWRYGPVIPALYQEFKDVGGRPITRRAAVKTNAQLDDDTKKLIEAVWQKYKNLSALQLSSLTHEPGSAWYLTVQDASPFESLTIPTSLIVDEFERRRHQSY